MRTSQNILCIARSVLLSLFAGYSPLENHHPGREPRPTATSGFRPQQRQSLLEYYPEWTASSSVQHVSHCHLPAASFAAFCRPLLGVLSAWLALLCSALLTTTTVARAAASEKARPGIDYTGLPGWQCTVCRPLERACE